MKFVSWNVNGLRACVQKGFLDFFNSANADFFCLQETKLQEGQITLDLPGYEQYWCCAEKKGYSGTAVFTKHKPQSVRYGIGVPELDTEGRVITLEYPEFYLVTCYTPNAQRGLARIEHRMQWEEAFRGYLTELDKSRPVVLCGDLNVAHQEIDLKNPAANRGNAGFSDQEREAFGKLLDSGFTDTFRYLNPTAAGCYTWWSYMFNARQNNAGWRIDYFLVSNRLQSAIYSTPIHSGVMGSDHCPVELDLEVSCNGGIWQSEPEGTATQRKAEKPPLSSGQKNALRAGIAAGLLAAGFAGGFFTHQLLADKEDTASVGDWMSYLSSSVNFVADPLPGIVSAETAGKMTTDRLIDWVATIPELQAYGGETSYDSGSSITLTENDYETYKNTYPVLAELENRSDAAEKMWGYCAASSLVSDKDKVLRLLLDLDVYALQLVSAESAAEMSTEDLARYAVKIPNLSTRFSLASTPEVASALYLQLKEGYPFLAELETRPDAYSALLAYTLNSSRQEIRAAAGILLGLDVYQETVDAVVTPDTLGETVSEMSTRELITEVVKIQELLDYQLSYSIFSSVAPSMDEDDYAEIKAKYPVLAELETRSDAYDELTALTASGANLQASHVALVLLTLNVYQDPNPAGEVQIVNNVYFNCYIYEDGLYKTENQLIPPGGTEKDAQWFYYLNSSNDHAWTLDTLPDAVVDMADTRPNFWLRVELTDKGKNYIFGAHQLRIYIDGIELTEANSAYQLGICSYNNMEGWFVYGFLPWDTEIEICVCRESGVKLKSATYVCEPVLTSRNESSYTTDELAYIVIRDNDFDSGKYTEYYNGNFRDPFAAALLERPDCIDSLLDIVEKYDAADTERVEKLLQTDAFRQLVTEEQQKRCKELTEVQITVTPMTGVPTETNSAFVFDGLTVKVARDDTNFASKLPAEGANCYAMVSLNDYGILNYSVEWKLNIYADDSGSDFILNARPYYNKDGRVAGWFVYGYVPHSGQVTLRVSQYSATITSLADQVVTLEPLP